MLNGRLEPCGFVEVRALHIFFDVSVQYLTTTDTFYCALFQGFTAEIGASGSFCPRHLKLPVTAAFFSLSDDGGPSPYLVSATPLSIKNHKWDSWDLWVTITRTAE